MHLLFGLLPFLKLKKIIKSSSIYFLLALFVRRSPHPATPAPPFDLDRVRGDLGVDLVLDKGDLKDVRDIPKVRNASTRSIIIKTVKI